MTAHDFHIARPAEPVPTPTKAFRRLDELGLEKLARRLVVYMPRGPEIDGLVERVRQDLKGVASNLGLIKLAAASGELMKVGDEQISKEWRQRLAMLNANLSHGRAALEARGRARDSVEKGGNDRL